MADERFAAPGSPAPGAATGEDPEPGPATSLFDPRVIQLLSTEHWSLLSARSLVYNEAFTRGAMFLAFLSASWVALALVAQAVGVNREFQAAAALILAFDLVLGLTTYARIIRANQEDYLAVRGMARIRHVYTEIAPSITPVIVSSIHDDQRGVMVSYASPPEGGLASMVYAMSTSAGMIGLITAMIGGVLAFTVLMLLGTSTEPAVVVAAVVAVGVLAGLVGASRRYFAAAQRDLDALYPSPD
jgi:hypothetical protein